MKNKKSSILFDWKWYANRHGLQGEDAAWHHYSTEGVRHCLNPNPLFNSKWYLARHPESLKIGALRHFMSAKVSQALCPSPHFESDAYLNSNPDVRSAGVNPFVHYMEWGRHEGRLPNSWCNPAYSGNLVFDTDLPADFLPDDMIGYIPHYSTLARLMSGAEASAFFSPNTAHWIFAKLAQGDEKHHQANEVFLMGGRREIFTGSSVFAPDYESYAPERYRAFQVKYAVSPIIRNAISMLGRDLDATEELEFLRHEIAKVVAVNPNIPLPFLNVVVDADFKPQFDHYLARSRFSSISVVYLEKGYLCKAVRPS